jgi:hypothetical protein
LSSTLRGALSDRRGQVSATNDKLPPEAWNPDGTITRAGCKLHPAFIFLCDQAREEGKYVELYGAGKLELLALREVQSHTVTAQQYTTNGLEAAAAALSDEESSGRVFE